MLSCNCLNITIESETNEFPRISMEALNLSQDEMLEPFFRQAIREVRNFKRIHNEHAGLVLSKCVGNWSLHRCLNCDLHTHAVHKRKGSYVLVSSKLITASTIKTLRDSESFSPIFKVIVLSTNGTDDTTAAVPSSQNLPAEVELALTGLKQRTNEAISREIGAVEERVRSYAEMQYAALDKFKQTAHSEHNSLVKTIVEKRHNSINTVAYPPSPNNNRALEQQQVSAGAAEFANERPKSQREKSGKKSGGGLKRGMCIPFANQCDTEDFFLGEDSDGYMQSSASERDDSDRDEEEANEIEGTRIVRSRSASYNMAKSLPVNIPTFMSQHRNRADIDDVHDDFREERPSDIAASIKALAKSVHGDTVFGDLPRPRFSTQI